MTTIRLNDFDATQTPETIRCEWPTDLSVYAVDESETDVAPALTDDGVLISFGVPVVSDFAVVSEFTTTTASFEPPVVGTYRLEKSSDASNWTTVATLESDAATAQTTIAGVERYWRVRIDGVYDADAYWTQATTTVSQPHLYAVYANALDADVDVRAPSLTAVIDYIPMSKYFTCGETPALRARIVESSTGAPRVPSDFTSIKYSAKRIVAYGTSRTVVYVDGHADVAIPFGANVANSAIKTALVTGDPRWTLDSTGYNFYFEPNGTSYDLLPEPGTYEIDVTFVPVEGNTLTITWTLKVK